MLLLQLSVLFAELPSIAKLFLAYFYSSSELIVGFANREQKHNIRFVNLIE